MKKKNQFRGVWTVVLAQQNDHNGLWITYKRFKFGEHTFDFDVELQNSYAGIRKMVRSAMGCALYGDEFRFSAKGAKLYITIPDESRFRLTLKRNTLKNKLIEKFKIYSSSPKKEAESF